MSNSKITLSISILFPLLYCGNLYGQKLPDSTSVNYYVSGKIKEFVAYDQKKVRLYRLYDEDGRVRDTKKYYTSGKIQLHYYYADSIQKFITVKYRKNGIPLEVMHQNEKSEVTLIKKYDKKGKLKEEVIYRGDTTIVQKYGKNGQIKN